MAVIDTIDGYNLRRDTLLNYLRKLFPGDSSSITAEVWVDFGLLFDQDRLTEGMQMSDGTVYRMRIPRSLSSVRRLSSQLTVPHVRSLTFG